MLVWKSRKEVKSNLQKMKYLKFTLLFILFIPLIVKAEEKVSTDEFKVVGETTKYYKTVTILNDSEIMSIVSPEVTSFTTEIAKEEYDSVDLHELFQLNGSTTVQTEYKSLKTTMSENGSRYRYRVELNWKNIPKVRSYDIIAIGHYSTVEVAFGPIFEQKFCHSAGDCTEGAAVTEIIGINGVGDVFSLPSGTLTSLSQSMYFDVQKSSSTTVKNQIAAGDYAHATKTITRDNAKKLRVDIAGIIHDSSVESYYDTIGAAVVSWTGSW